MGHQDDGNGQAGPSSLATASDTSPSPASGETSRSKTDRPPQTQTQIQPPSSSHQSMPSDDSPSDDQPTDEEPDPEPEGEDPVRMGNHPVDQLPPSAKAIRLALRYKGDLSRKELMHETRLPSRTVDNGTQSMIRVGIVETKTSTSDARKTLYSICYEPDKMSE